MANALFVDALKGYEYFLRKRGEISLEEVNLNLERENRNPIALRTFTHYKKLLANGFRSYIPINKFDVFQSLGKIQIAADRRRYKREISDTPVKISRDGKNWIKGKLIDKSIVGFGVITNQKFPTPKGVPGWVRISGHKDIPVVFVWRKHSENSTRIGIRALEFISLFRLSPDEIEPSRLKGLFIIHRDVEGDLYWENIFGTLGKVDELLKGVTDLLYTLEDGLETEIHVAQSILRSIEFGSPGELQTKIDLGIAEILQVILDKIQFSGLQKRKLRAEIESLEILNEKERIATENLKIETMRNAVKLGREIQEAELTDLIAKDIKNLIPQLFQIDYQKVETFTFGSPELAILQKRVLPAIIELVAGDDTDFKIKVSIIRLEDN